MCFAEAAKFIKSKEGQWWHTSLSTSATEREFLNFFFPSRTAALVQTLTVLCTWIFHYSPYPFTILWGVLTVNKRSQNIIYKSVTKLVKQILATQIMTDRSERTLVVRKAYPPTPPEPCQRDSFQLAWYPECHPCC